jgi:hypothetical protein
MNNKYIRSFSTIIWDSDLIASRLSLALAEFFWSIMLLWPGNSFDRQTYLGMSHVFTEEAWGLVFLMSGVTQLSILLLNNYHSLFARYFAGWNATLWLFTVSSMLLSVYPPPAAIGGEIALTMAAVWIYIRPYILAEGFKKCLTLNQYKSKDVAET